MNRQAIRAAIDDDAFLSLARDRYTAAEHPWWTFLGDLAYAAVLVAVVYLGVVAFVLVGAAL